MLNPSNTKLIRLEIAKTGTFGAQGSTITAEDLKEVIETFDGKCPVSLGHYMTKQDWWPQWGNVENITLEERENGEAVLIGDISVNEVLYEAMKEGFYPSWSVSIPQRAADGKRYLHLCDTGRLPDDTMDFLKALGKRADAVSCDCTFLWDESDPHARHMNVKEALHTVERLTRAGICDDRTVKVITHFSHNGVPSPENLARAEACGFVAAYDGMEITI